MSTLPSPSRPGFTAVRGLALAVALPIAGVGLGGCGGGSGSASTGPGATTQSGPAIVAAGKGGSGSSRAKSGAASRTRTDPTHGASTGAKATQGSSTPTTTTSGSGSTHAAGSAPSERAPHRFAGSGNTRLGTIVVRSPQVLAWRTARPPIQIFAANGFMLVNSSAPSGSIHLSRGTYRSVRVAAHASWSIELRSKSY